DYNGQDGCGLPLLDYPSHDLKETTSCGAPRNVTYPITEPVRMTEPAVCPK
ncbi:hypothetical protein WNP73_29660, partial [Klebsiella pneumoniae]